MRSIRLKMVIMYIMLVFIVMITCGTFTILSLQYNENNKSEKDLSDAADRVIETVIAGNNEEGFQGELRNIIVRSAASSSLEYYILKDNDTILAASVVDNLIELQSFSPSSSVIIRALSGESVFSSGKYLQSYKGNIIPWMEYARPIFRQDGTVNYVVYIRIDATGIYDSIRETTVILVWGLVIALVVAIILGIFFANSVNEPIVMLTKKAREFAAGKLDQVIEAASNDEIGQLTVSFNNMAKELNNVISEIESEKNKVNIIFNNMTDGALAYDIFGKFIHGNDVCTELTGICKIETLSLDEVLCALKIKQADQPFAPEIIKDTMININERFLNINCGYYQNKKGEVEGIIIVIQDLTKHITLDNMRKEFVANVSHELRTPLTTIKSYTETLIDETEEGISLSDGLDFLKVIDGETDRMTLLVNDLLELSRLDNKQISFNISTVDLVALVELNVKKHKHLINKNGDKKDISFKKPDEVLLADLDPERINQVINNIISNSLRYSDEKALVEVSVYKEDNFCCVTVEDNGVGIPDEDIDRIFERFYRVDKARSRKLGGTGLGLSISKEIIEFHGGKIKAKSKLGQGTVMTLCLPAKVIDDN